MRKWMKIGLIGSVGVLTLGAGLSLGFAIKRNQNTQQDENFNDNELNNDLPTSGNNTNDSNINQAPSVSLPTTPNLPNQEPTQPSISPTKPNTPSENEPPLNPTPQPDQGEISKPNIPIAPELPPLSNDNEQNNDDETIDGDKDPSWNGQIDEVSSESEYDLKKHFDKYIFLQKTTNYYDYFNQNQLYFSDVKVKNNTYTIFSDAIKNSDTFDKDKMELKIKIYYQINSDNTSLKLWIKWSTKLKNISFNVIKNYYNKITIKLK